MRPAETQAFRYIIAPEKIVHLSREEAEKKSQNYLREDLHTASDQSPVTFHLKAQLAGPRSN